MMKYLRMISFLSAACLVCSGTAAAMPAEMTVFAAEEQTARSGKCGKELNWECDTGMHISGKGEMDNWTGKDSPWYELLQEGAFSSIVIEKGVTSVGDYAFSECRASDLYVEMPESVTAIGTHAFYKTNLFGVSIVAADQIGKDAFSGCDGLNSVYFEEQVKHINDHTFRSCKELQNVIIMNPECEIDGTPFSNSDENGEAVFEGTIYGWKGSTAEVFAKKHNYRFVLLNPVASKMEDAPVSGTCGENVTWKYDAETKTLTIEGKGEMQDYEDLITETLTPWRIFAKKLETVEIKDGVTGIGAYAFFDLHEVTKISIPESVTHIGRSAFGLCRELTDISIPKNVTCIGESAFNLCENLPGVEIPAGVTEIESYTFDGCSCMTSFTIPSNITCIGKRAFAGCDALKEIDIPDSVEEIGMQAFYECIGLTSVRLPENIIKIPSGAFQHCSALTEIKIPKKVKGIGYLAFEGCTALKSVEIPEGVRVIDIGAFCECSALETIELPRTVARLESGALFISGDQTECALKSVTVKNPNCLIFNAPHAFPQGVLLRGYEGSTVEALAKRYSFQFESLGESVSTAAGDFDGDGQVSVEDAQNVLDCYAESLVGEMPFIVYKTVDVNQDGSVDGADALLILYYYMYNTLLDKPTTWEEILKG